MMLMVSRDLQQAVQHWLEFLLLAVAVLLLLLHANVMQATMKDSMMKWSMSVVCDDAEHVLL
jgi:hypothetical protein